LYDDDTGVPQTLHTQLLPWALAPSEGGGGSGLKYQILSRVSGKYFQ